MKRYAILFLGLLLILCGCTTKSPYTDEQRKEMETRIIEADTGITFQSIMSVLQDKGYVISHTDFDAGVLVGDSGNSTGFFGITRKHEVVATMQPFGENRSKTRITFRQQSSYGSTNWLTGAANTQANTTIISTPEMLSEVYEAVEREAFQRKNLDK